MEWLGYLIDVKKGLVGISNKKVLFLESWIREVLSRGCAGKGHARGIGVHGFPIGPLKPPRPFLALVYRVDFKLGPGSFTGLPLAIRCRCCGSCRKRCV